MKNNNFLQNIQKLKNSIVNKRKITKDRGSINIFTWRPKQVQLNKLISEIENNNGKITKEEINKLRNILNGIVRLLNRKKYKQNNQNIQNIKEQVMKIKENINSKNVFTNSNEGYAYGPAPKNYSLNSKKKYKPINLEPNNTNGPEYKKYIEKLCKEYKNWIWITKKKDTEIKMLNKYQNEAVSIMLNNPGIMSLEYHDKNLSYVVSKNIKEGKIILVLVKYTNNSKNKEIYILRPHRKSRKNQYLNSIPINNKILNNWKIIINQQLKTLNKTQKIAVNIMLENKGIFFYKYDLGNVKFEIQRNGNEFDYQTFNLNKIKKRESFKIVKKVTNNY